MNQSIHWSEALKNRDASRRRVRWFSAGAASAVATKLDLVAHPGGVVAYCDTGSEDEDNSRFSADCAAWFGCELIRIKSDEFPDTWSVWERRAYMSGIAGASCTGELKVAPRLAFQLPDDVHVFGYTADRRDIERAAHFRKNYPDLEMVAPLIERGITKAGALALLFQAGIEPPRTYAMGFPNANCLKSGCVKATSPDYWALHRREFPEGFAKTAAIARRIGCRLARINDQRVFIDEIPADWPTTNPIAPACDFLCHIAGSELAA